MGRLLNNACLLSPRLLQLTTSHCLFATYATGEFHHALNHRPFLLMGRLVRELPQGHCNLRALELYLTRLPLLAPQAFGRMSRHRRMRALFIMLLVRIATPLQERRLPNPRMASWRTQPPLRPSSRLVGPTWRRTRTSSLSQRRSRLLRPPKQRTTLRVVVLNVLGSELRAKVVLSSPPPSPPC